MQPLKIGFVMDPLETINPEKDTTLALMLEAQSRGWKLFYFTLNTIEIKNDSAYGLFKSIEVNTDSTDWYNVKQEHYDALHNLDIILMRKDPPFNTEYIISTYILEKAEKEGVLVLNKPSALRNANEKIYASNFTECSPPTIITRSKASILTFLKKHGKIILKPVDKMGGKSVFVVNQNDPNTFVIIEEITKNETEFVVAQVYISEIESSGDKRILLINGEPIKFGISRFPQGHDHRGNMAVGGKVKGFKLTERDLWICSQIKDELISQGLFFVGLDVIGDYMTEINVTSPTGVNEISQSCGENVARLTIDALQKLYNVHLTTRASNLNEDK
ncbi:glutathione synthase [Winogradskyella vincentii]|uniref:Glutathione synthetase n=1 Tax=Winogradskyella vincentii TaxID=2877122 RepID=A0ABS7Y309_9FLAO|nr:glutathione synthase [Winogradskyella vincentii]MCA0153629.1 glutathione synthase [Winogradskyella vincentii]